MTEEQSMPKKKNITKNNNFNINVGKKLSDLFRANPYTDF